MKYTILILLNIVVSQTILEEGEISGILRQEDSPFIINGSLWVMEDSTLTIEPGCRLLFNHPDTKIFCFNSNLHAIGTEEDSIVFTRATHDMTWHGISFHNANNSILEYCTIEWSGHNMDFPDCGLGITFSDVTLRHVLISDNDCPYQGVGLHRGPIELWDSRITIENSIIRDNGAETGWHYAAIVGGGASIESPRPGSYIKNSIFHNNRCTGSGGGIDLAFAADNLIIENSVIANNQALKGGGMTILFNSYPIIKNSIFYDNVNMYIESYPEYKHFYEYANNQEFNLISSIVTDEEHCLFYNSFEIYGQATPVGYGCDYPNYDFMNTDPMFVDAENGDFRLLPQSPAINAGTGDPDPDGTPPDIGAYYFPLELKGDLNFDDLINIQDILLGVFITIGSISPWNSQIWAIDMNDDGNLDVADIVLIVNEILEE